MALSTIAAIESEIAELDGQIAALQVQRARLQHRLGGLRSGGTRRAMAASRREKIKAALRRTDHERYARNQSSFRAIAEQYSVSVRTVGAAYAELKQEVRDALSKQTWANVEQFHEMLKRVAADHEVSISFVWNLFKQPYRPNSAEEFSYLINALGLTLNEGFELEDAWAHYVSLHRPNLLPFVSAQWIGIEPSPHS